MSTKVMLAARETLFYTSRFPTDSCLCMQKRTLQSLFLFTLTINLKFVASTYSNNAKTIIQLALFYSLIWDEQCIVCPTPSATIGIEKNT